MSIPYISHMMDLCYNLIYFFNDLISSFEICISTDFLYEAKLTSEVLLNFELSTYSVLFNKLTL